MTHTSGGSSESTRMVMPAGRSPTNGLKRALVLMGHPGHGGLMRSLATLDRAAGRYGWQLHFVFPAATAQVEAAGLMERARYCAGIHHWRRLGGRLRLPFLLANLAREVRRHDARVVYCATLSSFPYACLAARACGVGELVHIYSSYEDESPYRKYWLGRARHAVAPSRDSLERAAAAIGGFAGGAEVVYNGVDVACIEAAAAAPGTPVPRPGRGPVIGMVANLDRRKNPLDLVEATARLAPRFPTLEVVLVGAFPDPEYRDLVLGRAQALGVAARITVTGFQANPFPLIDACDVVALPTLRDPFPIALLEAMALRKPVVSTAVGGVPEMIVDGETGFVVPPGDVDALAARLEALLQDRERRRVMGEAGRRRMETVFTLDGFVRRMFAAFERAAAG